MRVMIFAGAALALVNFYPIDVLSCARATGGIAVASNRAIVSSIWQDCRFSWTTNVAGQVPHGEDAAAATHKVSTLRAASRNAGRASACRKNNLPAEPPNSNWREHMEGIRTMRRSRDADVDFTGARALKESTQNAGSEDDARFQAKHIARVSRRLAEAEGDRSAGAIPDTVEGLLDLPGVGPKMAYLVMDVAWGRNEGICVDTHVHRISNRLGWVDTWNRSKPRSQNPEKTRKHLEAWFPREHWSEVNGLLVGFGQQVCRAVGPSCSTCGIRDTCPSSARGGDLSKPPNLRECTDAQRLRHK